MWNLKKQLCEVLKLFYFVGLMGLFMVSCIDERDLSQSNGEDNGSNDPALSPDFSTKKVVQINLSYDVPENFRVAFELYTQNPVMVDAMKSYVKNKTLLAHVSGKTDAKGKISLTIEVPSFAEDIFVYSPTAGVPMLLRETIVGGKVELSSATSVEKPADMSSTRANQNLNTSDDCCYDWKTFEFTAQTLGEWDKNGKPNYLSEPKIFSEKFNDAVNSVISPMKDNEALWNSIENKSVVKLSEKANVSLYFVKHNSGRKNALAYYVYEGEREPSLEEVNKSLVIAFPNLEASSGLNSGDCVKLKYRDKNGSLSDEFPAGSKIGFALILDTYENEKVTQPSHVVYSNNLHNAYNFRETSNHDGVIMGSRPHMVTFKADENFVIAFEDMPRGGTMPGTNGKIYHSADYSDDVFVLYSDPTTALPDDVPDVTPEPGPEPEPAFKISSAGYYAFEDNWPKIGDYDMNDVVLKYTRHLRCDENYNVTGIDETYEFINNGATKASGFGYEIKGLKQEQIREVTITSNHKCAEQGLDKELSNATIMLFSDGKTVPKNTIFEVKTRLTLPVSYMNVFAPMPPLFQDPYNPFIVVGGYSMDNILKEKRLEVHLPKYAPTSKADISFFGKDEDISDPGKGLYYIRKGNQYPFALELKQDDLATEFKVPVEEEEVDVMYPKFNSWVKGGCGKTDADWYLHPIK